MTCSPDATTASYSRASWSTRGVAAPFDQPVGGARHGRDHHRDLVAGIDLALDVARHVADALDVGDRGAAELHHQASHGEPSPSVAAHGAICGSAGAKWRVYITARSPAAATAAQYIRRQAVPQPRTGQIVAAWPTTTRRSRPVPTPPSMPPRSPGSRGLPANGGTPPARWRCCTSSTRSGSPISATRPAGSFGRDAAAAALPRRTAHPRHRLRRRHPVRAAGAARRRRGGRRSVAPPTSRPRSSTPRRAASRSTTARPPRRRWRMPASASTWCWPWRWSSTSPTSACSCAAAPRWSSPAG